jgi:hypothetical protein
VGDKQTWNKTNKHIKIFQVQEQQNFIPSSSGVRHLQHLVPVLVFKQKLCLSLARWLGRLTSFIIPIFQWQLLSQLLPQWGVACPQVPEISSVVHQQSFFCLAPFLWSKVSVPSAGPLLSACCDGLLIVFQFCNVIWLWMLLMLRRWALWTAMCPISSSDLSPALCWPVWLSSLCLLKVHVEISSLLLPLSRVHSEHPASSAAWSFSVPYYSGFLGRGLGGSVCPGGYAGLSQRKLWEYRVPLICSPFGLLYVSQAGLELASGGAGALLFSQCNMALRSFVWAGDSGCWSPDSSWCFFLLPSAAPASQQNFWFMELTLSASAF